MKRLRVSIVLGWCSPSACLHTANVRAYRSSRAFAPMHPCPKSDVTGSSKLQRALSEGCQSTIKRWSLLLQTVPFAPLVKRAHILTILYSILDSLVCRLKDGLLLAFLIHQRPLSLAHSPPSGFHRSVNQAIGSAKRANYKQLHLIHHSLKSILTQGRKPGSKERLYE